MANIERGIMRLMRIANYPVEVVEVRDFSSLYRRIRFSGPELLATLEVSPTLWMRIWAPNERTGDVSQRAYTFVAVDEKAGTFDVDFVLHDIPGPAGDWARQAEPGQRVEVAITPAHLTIPREVDHWVLAGDLTALPAINSLIEAAPARVRVSAAVEDAHADHHDLLPVSEHPQLDFSWIGPAQGDHGGELAAWIRGLEIDPADVWAWGAGERSLVKAVRSVCKDAWALERGTFFTQAYWIEGKAGR